MGGIPGVTMGEGGRIPAAHRSEAAHRWGPPGSAVAHCWEANHSGAGARWSIYDLCSVLAASELARVATSERDVRGDKREEAQHEPVSEDQVCPRQTFFL
jgi:hypothetical protein